jgi:hypothetical protein
MKKSPKPKVLDPECVAKKLCWPVEKWPGNCYAVALAMLDKKIVKGEPRYGHWLGPVEPGTMFYGRGRVVRHGWIDAGGALVVDPTRWVFQGVAPYIYYAPDFDGWYDAGGNVLQEELFGDRPVPSSARTGRWYESPPELSQHLQALMGSASCSNVTREQLSWLANRPLPRLGAHARPIFRWIIALKLGAYIPIDNRMLVLGKEG